MSNPVPPPVHTEEKTLLQRVNERCKLFYKKWERLEWSGVSALIVPTVGRIDDARFPGNGEYLYVHRQGLTGKLVGVLEDWQNEGKRALQRNILGFRRSGKSYTLATFVCSLRSVGHKVLYIHNCSYWAHDPEQYLKAEALSTFYGDSTKQSEIVAAQSSEDILRILTNAKVIVVADQVGSLYQKYSVAGQAAIQSQESLTVLNALNKLSAHTLVFTAASAQKTPAFVDCLNNCNTTSTIHAFDGFSRDEFAIFQQRLPAYSGLDDEGVEKLERLTGLLPGLLTLPKGDAFNLRPDPVTDAHEDGWITEIQQAVTQFVSACLTHVEEKHKASHEAAVFGSPYTGDDSIINFDIVSLPTDGHLVFCPSAYCKDLVSDFLAKTDKEHKKKRLGSLREVIEKNRDEPTKLGDAAEDYLITYMEVYNELPMKEVPGVRPELFPNGHIPLAHCRKFGGLCPAGFVLNGDLDEQLRSGHPMAIAYFPSGKFLRYIDFVVRLVIPMGEDKKDLMIVVAGQITLSPPEDHSHTWKFFEEDFRGWQGAEHVDTRFVLAWFTPHPSPALDAFSFEPKDIAGETVNIPFGGFPGLLHEALSPLCNQDYYKPCACKSGCPKQCGCRKAGIPCRQNCTCKKSRECQNTIEWTVQKT